MSELTNEEFMEFIESYNDFSIPLSEMTKNHKGKSLVVNDFKSYSLDDIIFFNMEYSNYEYPRSTDTIYFKNKNSKPVLYLMEFKFMDIEDSGDVAKKLFYQFEREYERDRTFNEYLLNSFMDIIQFEFGFADIEDYEVIAQQLLDRFKNEYEQNQTFNDTYLVYYQKILNRYVESVFIDIIFKVIETLNIVIPELYEKYCVDKNIPIKDIRRYLRTIEKKFVLTMGNDSMNLANIRIKSKNRNLQVQLEKLVRSKIIDDFEIITNFDFELFLEHMIK